VIQNSSSRTSGPVYRRPRAATALNILDALVGATAIGTLLCLYGGFSPGSLPLSRDFLETLQRIIVGFFVFDRLLRVFWLARDRRRYLKDNWLDYVLIVLFLAALTVAWRYQSKLVSAGALFVIITQVYLLAVVVLRTLSANVLLAGSGLPPSWLLIASFGALCLLGSGLLMLPAAVHPEYQARWFYPDALFTSVSATCVTGLVVVPNTGEHFTLFGQAVILALIQLGGLGIMIFGAVLAMLVGKALSLRGTETVGEMLASDRIGEIGRTVRFVVFSTLIVEAVGAVLLYGLFRRPDVWDAAGRPLTASMAGWYSVFHSVAAFCNAGFSLYTDNLMQGVGGAWARCLRDHWQVLGVIAPLIVLGGLGFPVLSDALAYLRVLAKRIIRRARRRFGDEQLPQPRLSLHSKIVLITTVLLIVLGAVGLLALEEAGRRDSSPNIHGDAPPPRQTDWQNLGTGQKVSAAVFQSITARTAGFNTLPMNELTNAGKAWLCGLMTIGGSPASTAGGIKTSTFALLVLAVWSVLRRRDQIEAFHRGIPDVLLRRAVTLVMLYLLLVIVIAILLAEDMPNEKFVDLLFESSSACGTVGLSTGVTLRLEVFGKFALIAGMFIGRVGPLTLVLALTAGMRRIDYSYPQETVAIG
jgi:trk system potassium uptake protein TrkH